MPTKQVDQRVAATRDTLRARAEAQSPAPGEAPAPLSLEASAKLVHELQVHQIELEMQNEELRRTALELEASRERYFDLYDLAPVGYLTLSERGLILEANLTAAGLLGEVRSALANQPLSRFFLPEDTGSYFDHRRRLLTTRERQACDLQLVTPGGAVSWVRLEMTLGKDAAGAPQIRAALSDIGKRKLVERLLRDKTAGLESALARLEALVGLLPVCPGCTRMLDETGRWVQAGEYLAGHAEKVRARGLCDQCAKPR